MGFVRKEFDSAPCWAPGIGSTPWQRRVLSVPFLLALVWMLLPAPRSFCAQAKPSRRGASTPNVATHVVLVTNMVIVTNYVITTNVVFATNGVASTRASAALPDLAWVPPADTFDWIQLKSGEWLKGRLKAMQERTLEFDSEELENMTFDWEEIRQLRSHRTLDVLAITGEKTSGPVVITPEQVLVGAKEPRVFRRDQLQSLTPGGSRERDYWSGKGSFGLTLRAGNSDQVESNAQLHLQRSTPETRLSLDYLGTVSRIDSVESANNHRVNTEFDLWLSRRFYLVLPFAEYYSDPFQNLAHRVTAGVGVGYDLIDRPKMEWNITTGPGYQNAWFESSQPGEPTETGAGALTFGSRFEWDITHRIELTLEYRGQYTSRQVGETTHNGVSTWTLELTRRFDLDLSVIWDRFSNPKTDAEGDQPKQSDLRLVIGLGVDF